MTVDLAGLENPPRCAECGWYMCLIPPKFYGKCRQLFHAFSGLKVLKALGWKRLTSNFYFISTGYLEHAEKTLEMLTFFQAKLIEDIHLLRRKPSDGSPR